MMLAVNLGSRGLNDARNYVEYVQSPRGTYWSDLRRSHGVEKPWGVKMWCLGNEMDGPWQVGHKEAKEYGRLADETAKALQRARPRLRAHRLWQLERQDADLSRMGAGRARGMLRQRRLHLAAQVFRQPSRDTLNFFGKIEETGRYIQAHRRRDRLRQGQEALEEGRLICFDEWNVWYHNREEDSSSWRSWDWPEAPDLLEEDYNLEDALFVGGLLNEFIRRSDRVKIACIAQLVNVIAPIRTETGGPAWKTSIYYPYQFASLYGRGTALNVAVDGPTYDCEVRATSPTSTSPRSTTEDGMVTVSSSTATSSEAMELDLELGGFGRRRRAARDDVGGKTCARPTRRRPRPGRAARRRRPRCRGWTAGWHAAAVVLSCGPAELRVAGGPAKRDGRSDRWPESS